MRNFLVVVCLFALSACSVTPRDAPQAAYEGTAAFATALKGANAYAAMPRCSATVRPPCSSQAVVDQIIVVANRADVAVRTAQTIAANTRADSADVQKAIASAKEAVAALVAIIPAS